MDFVETDNPDSWLGPYPGVVVDDEDPDRGGRLRVRVPAAYGAPDEDEKIEDDQLPWARPGALVTGQKSGVIAIPEVGAEVWVAFRGGDGERPVWLGGWFSQGNLPEAFKDSYDGGPKTWLLLTPNGHFIEMRYKSGEERIHIKTAANQEVLLDDVASKIEAKTGQYRLLLDSATQVAKVVTPTREMTLDETGQQAKLADASQDVTLDGAAQTVGITTPGQFSGNVALTASWFVGVLFAVTATAITLTAAAAVTLTGATVLITGIVTIATSLIVGAGTKKVVLDPMIAAFNAHDHTDSMSGLTSTPNTPITPGGAPPFDQNAILATKMLGE